MSTTSVPLTAPDKKVATSDADTPSRRSLGRRLASSTILYLAVALLLLILVFAVRNTTAFLGSYNIRELFTQASLLLVVAAGATFVIGTAGIDLSVGGVLVFSSVLSVKLMGYLGGQGWLVVLAGLVCALVCGLFFGLINGLLVTKARIPALIATLGTLGVSLGVAQVLTNGTDLTGVPVILTDDIGLGRLFGQIPWLVVVAVVITAGAAVVLHFTRFGQYTLAVGSNKEASRRAGIRVDRHLIKIYGYAGMLAGLAGFLSLARFATTTIAGHGNDNLQAISAVVLGGTSLFGGVATIAGTVIGVFIPTVLQNGFIILAIPPFWQQVAIGVVLVIAVYVDQLRRTSRDKN